MRVMDVHASKASGSELLLWPSGGFAAAHCLAQSMGAPPVLRI